MHDDRTFAPLFEVEPEHDPTDDELIDAEEAGAICGCSGPTFENYARTGRPKSNPAPAHVERDRDTGRKKWRRGAVRIWQASRTGSGNYPRTLKG